MLPADTGFVTLTVISDTPRFISALLPVKESEPMLKFLSLENVSALPAVMLPTFHAASEVTLRLLLSCRFSTRFPAEAALSEIVMPLPVPLALTSTRETLVLSLMARLLPVLSIVRLFVFLNSPPPESFSVWLPILSTCPV